MPKPEFSIDWSDFDHAARELSDAGFGKRAGATVAYAIRRIVNLVRKNVRAELGRRGTGRMRDHIRTRIEREGLKTTGGVRSTGVGSNLIVGGVRPHAISPGSVMPLYAGRGRGRSIVGFARSVEHPGFAADPFFHRGIQRSNGDIEVILKASTDTLVRELAFRMKGKS